MSIISNLIKQMAHAFDLIPQLFRGHHFEVILYYSGDRFYRALYAIKISLQIHCTGCTFQMKHLVCIAFAQGFD